MFCRKFAVSADIFIRILARIYVEYILIALRKKNDQNNPLQIKKIALLRYESLSNGFFEI